MILFILFLLQDKGSRLKSWTNVCVSVFHLIDHLDDNTLESLLPLIFPIVQTMEAHANQPQLKTIATKLLSRVSALN